MINNRLCVFVCFISLTLLSGCASASTKASLKKINGLVKNQIGLNQDLTEPLSETDTQKEIESILKYPLTAEGAVKIAVLNNPSLKASLVGLGISRADLMQSGLIHNPMFLAKIRESNEDGVKTNTEFEVKQDVTDLLFWPLRKRIANKQFQQAEYELTKTIVDFIEEVRTQFYVWQGAVEMLSLRKDFYNAQESDWELAQRQRQAGNINNLVLAEHKVAWQQAKIELSRSELENQKAREQLRNLLGLTSNEIELKAEGSLPDLLSDEFPLSDLEEQAVENRLDLAIKRQEIKTLEQALTLAHLGVIPSVNGGFNTERETDGSRVKGPVFEAEVPIFDHKQADRLRIKSQIEMSQRKFESMEAHARLEVRLAYGQLMTNKEVVKTYLESIPVRREIIKETLSHYNYMLKGVYDLLRVKQDEVNTCRDYIVALRDYWVSRSELEHAIGKILPMGTPNVPKKQAAVESIPESEHHHQGDQK